MDKIITFMRESRVARFLIPLGLILIVFGIIIFIINMKNSNYLPVNVIVTKTELYEEAYTDTEGNHMDATYKVFVKYSVDGKDYETELGILSGYKENDRLNIYYNPDNPNEITQTKSLIIPIIMVAGGIASLIGGIVSGVNAYKRIKKMKEQEKGWVNGQ